jgi:hypothetical protein
MVKNPPSTYTPPPEEEGYIPPENEEEEVLPVTFALPSMRNVPPFPIITTELLLASRPLNVTSLAITVWRLPICSKLPLLEGESVPLPAMVTVKPVTELNVLSLLGAGGTETVPVTVIVYSLPLPPLLIPFTASIQVAALFTAQEVLPLPSCAHPNASTLASITVKINLFFIFPLPCSIAFFA